MEVFYSPVPPVITLLPRVFAPDEVCDCRNKMEEMAEPSTPRKAVDNLVEYRASWASKILSTPYSVGIVSPKIY